MTRPLALSSVALLLVANLAVAQRPDRPRPRPQRETTVRVEAETSVRTVRRVSMVIGANVTLHGGHAVGPVKDIVINEDGCIEYIVVRYEEEYLPVPWTVVTVNIEERVIILDLDEARLAEAPRFAGDDWSVLVQADWSGRVTTYYQADRRRPGRDRSSRDRGDRPGRGDRPREERDGDDDRDADESDPEDRDPEDRGRDNPRRPTNATPGERPDTDDPATPAEEGEEQPAEPADDAAPSEEGGNEAPADEGANEAPPTESDEGAEQPETPTPPQPGAGDEAPQDD